jgi:adenylate cyclase
MSAPWKAGGPFTGPAVSQRLRSALPILAICILVSLVWDFFASRSGPEPGQPGVALLIGILIALPLLFFESSRLAARTTSLPFWASVLVRSLAYGTALTAIFLGMGLLVGALQRRTFAEFIRYLPESFTSIGAAFGMYLVIIFFRQLDRLLGPGVLLRYLTGRYHHPRRERRIFMFVDLKDSTGLAERLSLEAYYGLVNDFFRDVSRPVLDSRGEIYEYVGDEVVITWKQEVGARNANCVRAFFEIEKAVWANSGRYVARYGVVPEFKAGLHSGEVITAEMGDLKKEIAFSGEVLNVAARIQGECNRLGRRFLASRRVVDQLELPPGVTAASVGPVELRGTGVPTEIVALA